MAATLSEYALMSSDVYKSSGFGIGAWQEEAVSAPASSGFFGVAYKNGNDIVISYRGTQGAADMLTDLGLFTGNPVRQMKDAYDFYDSVRNDNPGANISFTGHSLGGALASFMAVHQGLEAKVFAAIASVDATADTLVTGGYDHLSDDPVPVVEWSIPEAVSTSVGKSEGWVASYNDVTNYAIYGELASYASVPALGDDDYIGTRVLLDGSQPYLKEGSQYSDYNSGSVVNLPGTVYSAPITTALHDIGLHAIFMAERVRMQELSPELPRLLTQLANANVVKVDGSDLSKPDIQQLIAENQLVRDKFLTELEKLKDLPANSVAKLDASVNTVLMQIAIQYAAKQAAAGQIENDIDLFMVNAGEQSLTVDLEWASGYDLYGRDVLFDYLKSEHINSLAEEQILDAPELTVAIYDGSNGSESFLLDKADEGAIGGSGVDSFQVADSQDPISGFVYGGDGFDSLDFSSRNSAVEARIDFDPSNPGDARQSFFEKGDPTAELSAGSIERIVGSDLDDVFSIDTSPLSHTIEGGDGDDTVDYDEEGNPITIRIVPDIPLAEGLRIEVDRGIGSQTDILKSVEVLTGSRFNDEIIVDTIIPETFNLTINGYKGESSASAEKKDIINASSLSEGLTVYIDENGEGYIQTVSSTGGIDLKNFGTEIKGSAYADTLVDLAGLDHVIDGGAGDDYIESQGLNAKIFGGADNDYIERAGQGTEITLGTGEDTVKFAANTLVTDASGEDLMNYYGYKINGATTFSNSESGFAYSLGGIAKIGFNTKGEMVVGVSPLENGWDGGDISTSRMYYANGENDPFAANEDLTTGIRVSINEIQAYRILETPIGVNTGNQAALEFMKLVIKDLKLVAGVEGVDPLVLDLDGDGLELTARSSVAPLFDTDGDQFKEHTGWVGPDDGLLAVDTNGNGEIDDVSELFGGVDSSGNGVSGFTELAAYDTNSDGKVDASDTDFDDLLIWRDLDQDGLADAGELQDLATSGIESISLTSTPDGSSNALNIVDSTGTFTRTDQTTGTVGDIIFRIDNYDTEYAGDTTIDPVKVGTRPDLKGRGTLVDLHVALSIDTTGNLASAIDTHLPNLNVVDMGQLRDAAKPILEAWTDVIPAPAGYGTNPDTPMLTDRTNGTLELIDFAVEVTEGGNTFWKLASGNDVLDGQGQVIAQPTFAEVLAQSPTDPDHNWETLPGSEVDFIERYYGENIPLEDAADLSVDAIGSLGDLLQDTGRLIDLLALRLAMQGPLSNYFAGIEFNTDVDAFSPTTNDQLVPMFEAIFNAAPSDQAGAEAWLEDWAPVITVMTNDYFKGETRLINPAAFLFSNIVAAFENVGVATDLTSAAEALGIPASSINTGSAGVRNGTIDQDLFYMTTGNDTALGGLGPDSYIFGSSWGTDIIDDQGSGDTDFDFIRFAHHNADDLTFTRDDKDLLISLNGASDTIRVKEQFHDIAPQSIYDEVSLSNTGINEIIFADGSVWTRTEVAQSLSNPLPTDDTIEGTDHTDYLNGGLGNDTLRGGNGADVYIFEQGSGQDTIEEQSDNLLIASHDFIRFGNGITDEDVTFVRNGNSDDLEIQFDGSTDTLTIVDEFKATETGPFNVHFFEQVEGFIFGDGYGYGVEKVMEIIVEQAKTDGDDTIYGFYYTDTIDGGLGNDRLEGGNEGDTYIFDTGYGNDIVHDDIEILEIPGFSTIGAPDKVLFGPGVDASDVVLTRTEFSDDLQISLVGDAATLTIEDQFEAIQSGAFGFHWTDRIESFEFDDGTIWGWQDIIDTMLAQASTSGNDTIYGFHVQDTIGGGAGNDTLKGGNDSDTYLFNLGDGVDTIEDSLDNILYADVDKVVFGAGIATNDIIATTDATSSDLILSISGTSDQVIVKGQLDRASVGSNVNFIEEFHFDDGTILDGNHWRQAVIDAQATSGDDTILGTNFTDTLAGGAGNDTLRGQGDSDTYQFGLGDGQDTIEEDVVNISWDDTDKVEFGTGIASTDIIATTTGGSDDLILSISGTSDQITVKDHYKRTGSGSNGDYQKVEEFHFSDSTVVLADAWTADVMANQATSGDDTIYGFSWKETLAGGAGNDRLEGRGDGDTYIFNLGDGQDVIFDFVEVITWDDPDKVDFGAGITTSNITVTQTGDDLVIDMNGTSDQLTVEDYFKDDYHKIEEFHFDDGTIWDAADISNALTGGGSGSGPTVTVAGTTGNDTLNGTGGDDVFDGDLGDDTINSSGGNDTFVYYSGDGNDLIDENNLSTSQVDTLYLGDLTPGDVTASRVSGTADDFILTVNATGHTIEVDQQFASTTFYVGLEKIEFSDGTEWDRTDIFDNAWVRGTTGNDTLTLTDSTDDTFFGDLGDDTLVSNNGNDTFIYRSGDGSDVIDDGALSSTQTDTLVFTDLDAADLTFSKSGNDVLIDVDGTSDQIEVDDQQISSTFGVGLEKIQFADGSEWDRPHLMADSWLKGTSAAETETGTTGDNVFVGTAGNDTWTGDTGDDKFVFGIGNGENTITDFTAGSGTDDLINLTDFDTLTTLSSVTALATEVSGDTTIDFGNGDKLILQGVTISSLHDDDFNLAA